MAGLGTRIRDWFNGGDPDGRAKLRAWATGEDGRWRGYTHSMGRYVTWLMVIACVLYPFTRGIGSILALLVAIFLMGGRAMIERQVRRDVSDLHERLFYRPLLGAVADMSVGEEITADSGASSASRGSWRSSKDMVDMSPVGALFSGV